MFSPVVRSCHPFTRVAIPMIQMSQTMWVEVQRMRRRAWRRCWVSPGGDNYKPSPAQPSPTQPSPAQPSPEQPSPEQPSPEAPEDRDTVRVPRRDLKWAAKLLQDLLVGKKVKLPVSTSREEVPFTVPDVMAGETDCALCHQAFKSIWSL